MRAAIELMKQNPEAFSQELAELRNLVLIHDQPSPFLEASSIQGLGGSDESRLFDVVNWMVSLESVTLVVLRTHLLPFDMLPNAVIDEINEWALDLTGDIALEEIDDVIVIEREVLAEIIASRE